MTEGATIGMSATRASDAGSHKNRILAIDAQETLPCRIGAWPDSAG